ncbi:Bug family tripartite tricarboxylate transporter substrate binding protein [Roseibium sp.]|uniref:Bug family tripartite tricarboxylate transporter substrate binding protein n=1 Tax=Roseibium sp. TaxID=1936156 RepID=UPI003B52EBD9
MSTGIRSTTLKSVTTAALMGLFLTGPVLAKEIEVNFLIPGGEGGGWDTTARTVGGALEETNHATVKGYENLTGAGGGRALLSLVNDPEKHPNTLMVQSTPLVIRALTGVYQNNWQDITPVATMISAYQAVAVPATSSFDDMNSFVAALKESPKDVVVAGGSGRLSLDHLTLGLIAQASGIQLEKLRYSSADGGKEALDRMLDGKVKAVVSGVGELLPAAADGRIRILGVTSAEPLPGLDVPTMKSQGLDVVFSNWRGFFTAPGASEEQVAEYRQMLVSMSETGTWTEARGKHKWEPLVLVGDELTAFLAKQEKDLGEILNKLQ